jgi:hypothetical protein
MSVAKSMVRCDPKKLDMKPVGDYFVEACPQGAAFHGTKASVIVGEFKRDQNNIPADMIARRGWASGLCLVNSRRPIRPENPTA